MLGWRSSCCWKPRRGATLREAGGRLCDRLQSAGSTVMAFVAANIGQLVVGLIIVEGSFDLTGLGGAIFESIRDRNRSLLVGLVTVVMVLVLVANAVADVLTALIDPRLRPTPTAR